MNTSKLPKETHAFDFFSDLINNSLFVKDIQSFRRKYGIPEDGYDFEEEFDIYFTKLIPFFINNPDTLGSFNEDIKHIFVKNKIPVNLFGMYRNFLIYNFTDIELRRIITKTKDLNYALDKSNENEGTNEQLWRETGRPYIKLLISENWTINSLELFLKKNRKLIYNFFKINRQLEPKKRRKKLNVERDILIHQLNKKSTDELKQIVGQVFPIKNRFFAISYILKEKYGYIVTAEVVKKVLCSK